MRRFALVLFVSLLAFSASSISTLMFAEPCMGSQQSSSDDDACPPMCVTCGCCTQSAEPVTLHITATLEAPFAEHPTVVPALPAAQVRDILHVPKRRGA